MQPIVDTQWLIAHAAGVILADVRWYADGRDPREEFERGHLPEARLVELEPTCAAPPSAVRGRHPLPEPAAFARRMAALGVGDGDAVVAYDDQGGVLAARLVWMLRALGHDGALLDAGFGPFPERGPDVPRGPRPDRPFTVPDRWPPDLLADADDAADPGRVVLDARPRERYEGAPDALDPRAGHIPGARSLPCRENLDAAGRLLDLGGLRRRFEGVGATGREGFISSCGSGVTACHTLLVAEHAGVAGGRLYPGSWSQWSRDPTRPAATGSGPA